MRNPAERLSVLNDRKRHYQLATWEVRKLFEPFGIVPNHCIDEDLIIRLAWEDERLMRFLGVEIIRENPSDELFGNTVEIVEDCVRVNGKKHKIPQEAIPLGRHVVALKTQVKDLKDKGQRPLCGCIISKDIGEYNTCPHLCEYYYANTGKVVALKNYELAKQSGFKGETITGR